MMVEFYNIKWVIVAIQTLYRLVLINGLSKYGHPCGITQQVATEAVVPLWFRDITVKER